MTPHQRKILDWISGFIAEHSYSPSYHEIALGCGLLHRGKAHVPVNALIASGHLIQVKGRRRSLQLSNPIERMSTTHLKLELARRGELYSPIIMAAIKRAGLEAYL